MRAHQEGPVEPGPIAAKGTGEGEPVMGPVALETSKAQGRGSATTGPVHPQYVPTAHCLQCCGLFLCYELAELAFGGCSSAEFSERLVKRFAEHLLCDRIEQG